ncbi:MAG: LysM peptidoglycan-binding domain-containing protein [Thermoleophilaceae bacterium]|nr:LysM peptidoglycan-binding domain-containing protein [Thermoleophilaceae bacterium]
MAPRPRSSLRLLAPAALVASLIAFAVVIGSSGVDESARPNAAGASDSTRSSGGGAQRPARRAYTVRPGDTLVSISRKTGVPVTRIEELNPELDPQSLVAGQRIKLRE